MPSSLERGGTRERSRGGTRGSSRGSIRQSTGPTARVLAAELAHVDVCGALAADVRAAIAAECVRVHRKPRELIVDPAADSREVYFLLRGRARVTRDSRAGKQITLQVLEDGAMFGELAAIDGRERTGAVIADTEVMLAQLDEARFHALLLGHPTFALAIVRRIVALARWLSERVFENRALPVKGRVCAELLRLSEQDSRVQVCITDGDMATRVGTTRENVARINGELKRDGIIARSARTIGILDMARLRALVEEAEGD